MDKGFKQMLVRNKWNGKIYKVILFTDNMVTLEREDGSQFAIQKKEYFHNYSDKK